MYYRYRLSNHKFNNCSGRKKNNGGHRQVHMVDDLKENGCDEDDDQKSVTGSKDEVVTYMMKRVLCAPKQENQNKLFLITNELLAAKTFFTPYTLSHPSLDKLDLTYSYIKLIYTRKNSHI